MWKHYKTADNVFATVFDLEILDELSLTNEIRAYTGYLQ